MENKMTDRLSKIKIGTYLTIATAHTWNNGKLIKVGEDYIELELPKIEIFKLRIIPLNSIIEINVC